MSKTLVLFVFHIFNDRCKKFIDTCIFNDPNVDFIIISNNKNARFQAPSYVKKMFRNNIGYDFGGWSDALLKDNLYQNYDNFIFVNSSVIGPFLRSEFKGKWIDMYLNGLKGDVKLFGTMINTMGNPRKKAHVQSYIFAVNKETLQYLIDEGIFSNTKYVKTFNDAIKEKEILMSRKIIDKGWNIGSLFPLYNGVDFRFKTKAPENYNIKFQDDVMYNKYFGYLWTEYDLVFLKGNRGIKFAKPVKEGYRKHRVCKYNILYILILLVSVLLFLRYRNYLLLLLTAIMLVLLIILN
jgi:hypothetical protein